MADAMTTDDADLNDDGVTTPEETEKYGAQLLRRLHQDASYLLQDYDAHRGPLEDNDVDGHLEAKCQKLVEEIEEIEALWEKKYGESTGHAYPPLGAGGPAEEEREETPAEESAEEAAADADDQMGSEKEELPDEDEVLEGMNTKQLRAQLNKALRANYGAKGVACTDKKSCKCAACTKKHKGLNGKAKSADDLGSEENQEKPGAEMTGAEIPGTPGGEEHQAEPGEERTEANTEGSPGDEETQQASDSSDWHKMMPHEKEGVGEAADYLKSLTDLREYGEGHRMEAYAHHKMLDKINKRVKQFGEPNLDAQVAGAAVTEGTKDMGAQAGADQPCPVCGQSPCVCGNAAGAGADGQPAQKELYWHKAVDEASRFCKELSQTHDIMDEHRLKAMQHHVSLTQALQQQDAAAGVDPGAVGEKQLIEEFARTTAQVEDLNGKVAKLLALAQ